jgi:hypothetical protein
VGLGDGLGVGVGEPEGDGPGVGDADGDGLGDAEGVGGATPALSPVKVVLKAGRVTVPPTSGIAKLN